MLVSSKKLNTAAVSASMPNSDVGLERFMNRSSRAWARLPVAVILWPMALHARPGARSVENPGVRASARSGRMRGFPSGPGNLRAGRSTLRIQPESRRNRMRRLLGLWAALAATMVFTVNGGQAFASHLECGDVITQGTTLDSDVVCPKTEDVAISIRANATFDSVRLDLNGHTVVGM